MDLFQAIERRRSIRAYKEDAIREDDLNRILDAGIQAPSAGNIQPWEFIVTRKEITKKGLAEAAGMQSFIAEAPLVITVCAREDDSASSYGDRGRRLFCIQDTAAAVENMLLAVTALGYGACWIGAFDEAMVRNVLRMPSNVRPVAIIPIGLPRGGGPAAVPRKHSARVVHSEFYAERAT